MSDNLNPTTILFDFYGTLMDVHTDERQQVVWKTLAGYLRYAGVFVEANTLAETYFSAVKQALSSSPEKHPDIRIREVLRQVLQRLDYNGHDAIDVEFARLLRSLSIQRLELFPDTLSTLQTLRRTYKLGLVSDAQREFIDPEIQMARVESFWDVRVVSSDFGYRKPDARLFRHALDALGAAAEETIYVGDNTPLDVRGAHNANLFAVLIDRDGSYRKARDKHVPDKIFANLKEMRDWLLGHDDGD